MGHAPQPAGRRCVAPTSDPPPARRHGGGGARPRGDSSPAPYEYEGNTQILKNQYASGRVTFSRNFPRARVPRTYKRDTLIRRAASVGLCSGAWRMCTLRSKDARRVYIHVYIWC
jgi:hypothetical protein